MIRTFMPVFLFFAAREIEMGSKIRYRKRTSNKINSKTAQKLVRKNLDTLVKLERENLGDSK
jgi:hypothetical protein